MPDGNKALVRRFYDEVFIKGNLDAVDELCTTDFVDHEAPPGMPPGIEGVKAVVSMYRTAFPDLHATVEDVVSEGDRAAARVTFGGTHKGEMMGMPPTGKSFEASTIDILRFEGGKAAEHWGVTDQMGMMQQLGVIPEQPGG